MILAAALALNVTPVLAANTTDKPYRYTSVGGLNWHDTTHYEKTNTSKVYVKPDTSPSKRTNVQTYCYVSGKATNKTASGTVTLRNGHAYGITNTVYEKGDRSNGHVEMWLKMRATSGTGLVSGNWSPDWTGKGDVAIV